MRKAQLLDMGDQLMRHLPVVEIGLTIAPPGPRVDLVNRQRLHRPFAFVPLSHPRFVTPIKIIGPAKDRSGFRRNFRREGEGVAFEQDFALAGQYFEFIHRTFCQTRNEDLPKPRLSQRPHAV